MFEFEELLLIAYKKERAVSRRLSKLTSLSAHAALTQTLEKSAGTQTLAELVSARHRERAATEQARHHREQERAVARAARKVRPAFRDAAAWHAWFDGSAHPNPGKIGIGGVLESPDGDVVKISARAGHGDSCEAEYLALIAVLEAEGAAYDIAGYRDAPPGLRIWCGATVDTADIEALGPWLDWAYASLNA